MRFRFAIFCLGFIAQLAAEEPLFTREGTDPAFATLIENGTLKPGERFAKLTVLGSRIDVNNELLEKQVGKAGAISKDIGLHFSKSLREMPQLF
jgi:hypothetical protein